MPPYRLVIFDFDGTLADSLPWFRSVFAQVARRFRLPELPPEEFEAMRSLSGREVMKRLKVPAWKLPGMVRHMRAMKLAAASSTPLFPGARRLLADLREAGVMVAVVSSDSEASVRAVLGPQTAALVEHFDCGAAAFGKASKFRRMLRRVGVRQGEALSVGDEVRDMEAARLAGIAFGAVAWGYTYPQALADKSPDHMFATFAEMGSLLLGRPWDAGEA